MSRIDANIRRAAVLVASLDRASADALLNQMSPDESRLVRRAVLELDEIDDDERETVIAQFVAKSPSSQAPASRPIAVPAGIDLDDSLASRFSSPADRDWYGAAAEPNF